MEQAVLIILYEIGYWKDCCGIGPRTMEEAHDMITADVMSGIVFYRLPRLPWLALKNVLLSIHWFVTGFANIFGGTLATLWHFPWLLDIALVVLR